MKNEKWKIDFKRRDTKTQRLFEHGKHEKNEKNYGSKLLLTDNNYQSTQSFPINYIFIA